MALERHRGRRRRAESGPGEQRTIVRLDCVRGFAVGAWNGQIEVDRTGGQRQQEGGGPRARHRRGKSVSAASGEGVVARELTAVRRRHSQVADDTAEAVESQRAQDVSGGRGTVVKRTTRLEDVGSVERGEREYTVIALAALATP